ncbi:hypothetical protein GCM10028793_54230 [Nocardiopsis oceani]
MAVVRAPDRRAQDRDGVLTPDQSGAGAGKVVGREGHAMPNTTEGAGLPHSRTGTRREPRLTLSQRARPRLAWPLLPLAPTLPKHIRPASPPWPEKTG